MTVTKIKQLTNLKKKKISNKPIATSVVAYFKYSTYAITKFFQELSDFVFITEFYNTFQSIIQHH